MGPIDFDIRPLLFLAAIGVVTIMLAMLAGIVGIFWLAVWLLS